MKRIITEEFDEYSIGFAKGMMDFIILRTKEIDLPVDLDDDFFSYGYYDAYMYYSEVTKINNTMNLNDIYDVINMCYYKRIRDLNELDGYEIPAFTLLLNNKKK